MFSGNCSEQRSRLMARIRSKDTGPEMSVRRALHKLGYRYRLHRSDLPGRPDLAFPSLGKVVFVNGCFWHMHQGCPRVRIPRNNRDYWKSKLERNRIRDTESIEALQRLGWEVLTVWECELRNMNVTVSRIVSFLNGAASVDHGSYVPYPDTAAPVDTTASGLADLN